ncbi:unnamed protein product [Angiostrongylus costaricensis]|uniref:Uncharacterized protein n=1 Tax=Angiostrongylus costaricensis TaxID=334426 RepID=A0A3P7HG13_ANGCS|nr:unnamed protein product [Angiostrongylus costaricensis]
MNPPPYSPQILDNLDKFSVGTLTVIGRELVSELTSRTHSLCMSLKAVSERKPPVAGDPEQLLEYCQMLMDKLVEIRLVCPYYDNDACSAVVRGALQYTWNRSSRPKITKLFAPPGSANCYETCPKG